MSDHRGYRRAVVLALIVTVLWSSSWVIIRLGLDDEGMPPLTFAGLRYVAAAIVLIGFVLSRPGPRRTLLGTRGRHLAALAALGLVLISLTQGAQYVAIGNQPAATTSLMLSFTPLLVVALAGRSLGEWATPRQVFGAVLVGGGAALYFSGRLGATVVGMTAAVICLLANVSGSLLGRWVHRPASSVPLVTTTVSMSIGAVALLAVGLAAEGMPSITPRAAAYVLWLAVVNTALAFTMWNHSLRHLTATESAVINNTMLIQIAVLAWLFLGETPSLVQVVGIAAVTVGIMAGQRARQAVRRMPPASSAATGTPPGRSG